MEVIWVLGNLLMFPLLWVQHLDVTFESPHEGLPRTNQAVVFSQSHRSTDNWRCIIRQRKPLLHSRYSSVLFRVNECLFLFSSAWNRLSRVRKWGVLKEIRSALMPRPTESNGAKLQKKEEKLFSSVNQSPVCSLNSRNLLLHCIAKHCSHWKFTSAAEKQVAAGSKGESGAY